MERRSSPPGSVIPFPKLTEDPTPIVTTRVGMLVAFPTRSARARAASRIAYRQKCEAERAKVNLDVIPDDQHPMFRCIACEKGNDCFDPCGPVAAWYERNPRSARS